MKSPDRKRFWILACGEQCGGEPVEVSGGKAVAALFWSGSVVPVVKEIGSGNWFVSLFLSLGMKISVGELVEFIYFFNIRYMKFHNLSRMTLAVAQTY